MKTAQAPQFHFSRRVAVDQVVEAPANSLIGGQENAHQPGNVRRRNDLRKRGHGGVCVERSVTFGDVPSGLSVEAACCPPGCFVYSAEPTSSSKSVRSHNGTPLV